LKAHAEERLDDAVAAWRECIVLDQNWYFPHYELAQAAHLVFNAVPPSSTNDHPFLPSPNSRCTNAMQQPSIQDIATAAATSKQSEGAVEMAMAMGTVC